MDLITTTISLKLLSKTVEIRSNCSFLQWTRSPVKGNFIAVKYIVIVVVIKCSDNRNSSGIDVAFIGIMTDRDTFSFFSSRRNTSAKIPIDIYHPEKKSLLILQRQVAVKHFLCSESGSWMSNHFFCT